MNNYMQNESAKPKKDVLKSKQPEETISASADWVAIKHKKAPIGTKKVTYSAAGEKKTLPEGYISVVFSSIASTSCKYGQTSSPGKCFKRKESGSGELSSVSPFQAVQPDEKEAIPSASNQNEDDSVTGWISLPPGKKSSPNVKIATAENSQNNKHAWKNNSFFLPKTLEKKLHNNIGSRQLPNEKSPKVMKRAEKRARQRARKLAERKKKTKETESTVAGVTINLTGRGTDFSVSRHEQLGDSSSTVDSEHVVEVHGGQGITREECLLLKLPYEVLTEGIMAYLRPEELASFGRCNTYYKQITEEGYLWQTMFRRRFPLSKLSPKAMQEWKLAYQLTLTNIVDRLRCFHTKRTFFEDVVGVGVDFTVNPKTRAVDYISLSQDLLSETAFAHNRVREDVFGNKFKLFLPLYFSEDHFQRGLPQIRKTIWKLCPEKKARAFDPAMVLDIMPKIVNTFVVLLSDEGISASQKSFDGLIRIHRVFMALAHEYPIIKREATLRLKKFAADESFRTKSACPNLGCILPLLMILDQKDFAWPQIRAAYLSESFDRSVLWVCKKYPQLEVTDFGPSKKVESEADAERRVDLTRDAMVVSTRLAMFHVYFLRTFCQGTIEERANRYDHFFGQPNADEEPGPCVKDETDVEGEASGYSRGSSDLPLLSFSHFKCNINHVMTATSWQQFFHFVGVRGPMTKSGMAKILRQHVKNSLRKGYHEAGMDFSRVQASGVSKILTKGQTYSASLELRRVVFTDVWGFKGSSKFLDATCLLYSGKERVCTVDYMCRENDGGAVRHSGDQMRENGGTHSIHLDLRALDPEITACVFVISAWNDATLADIISPAISFTDEMTGRPLCTYNLDSHDKVSHLTSVVMCKLYRTRNGGWHVQAIGDAHRGSAFNYDPIYRAVGNLL